MRTLVIGAGLAGISAAVRLGGEIVVVDADGLGGKARTLEPIPGWRVENGPHSFTHRADAVFDLIDAIGASSRVVRLGGGARYLLRDGRLVTGRHTFSAREWLRIGLGAVRAGRAGRGVTIGEWLGATFGAALATGPLGVATVGIWAARPEEVELESAFPALWQGLQQRSLLGLFLRAARGRPPGLYGFADGMGALPMAAGVKVRQAAVTALAPSGQGWEAEGVGGQFDAVVIAVDALAAARLLHPIAPASAEALDGVRYSPLVVAHWLSRTSALPPGFGWLAPPAPRRALLGTLFASDLHAGRCPPGYRSFASMVGGTMDPGALGLSDGALRDAIAAEHRALTGASVTIDGLHVLRHPRAVAIPGPGHALRVATAQERLPAGLVLAGAWCGAGAMNDAVKSGFSAAHRVAKSSARRAA